MEDLSNILRLEINKFKEIDSILAKLEQDGEIDKIHGLFRNLFENESQYTINGTPFQDILIQIRTC
jgi:hypothetical protein